jgi:hypothetical protein
VEIDALEDLGRVLAKLEMQVVDLDGLTGPVG